MQSLFLILLLLSSTLSLAQKAKLHCISGVLDFALDPMGNCYYLKNGDLIKANKEGKEIVRYSRKNIGPPTSFDVSNPVRILLFYAEFATVRVLDNNLIDQSEIDLRSMGFLQPRAMAGSPDQGIWIYEEITGSLVKLDNRLGTAALSVDLNQLLGKRPQPTAMQTSRQWVLMQDKSGLIVFDQFGTLYRRIAISKTPLLVQLNDEELVYEENNHLQKLHLKLLTQSEKPMPEQLTGDKILLNESSAWTLKEQELCLYQ